MQYACVLFYCHLWRISASHTFPHYLVFAIFIEKVIEHKVSVLFRLRNLSKTFFNLKIERYKKKCFRLQVKYPPIILLQMLKVT
jgi:hypothetical protein